ncbi:ABC transporter permease subunit [Camelliibacillus cellulosilyticus]|uniref:ABC transporter permease subunit n=1 Tax=Camelliibacillus cellulosilyticus TaxID=2174486 RepID=A0ABV9GQW6_9BACL
MKGTLVSLGLQFLAVLIGIVMISAVPSMFMDGIHVSWPVYWKALSDIVHSLSHVGGMTYLKEGFINVAKYKVFPDYWGFYGYSVVIFTSAFLISIIVGLWITYMTVMGSKRVIKVVKSILSFLESIPDLLIIAFLQFIVILFYQKTGVLLFNVAGAFDRTYFVPILTLAILPSILFFRIFLLAVLDEEDLLYVELARSKGLAKSAIILKHIYRNAIITLCTHLKSIFFILLSNLVVVEYIFNIYGLTWYIMDHPQLDILALSVTLFFLPVFAITSIIRLMAESLTGEKVVV